MSTPSHSDQLLVVLGATGNQGNAVLKHFARPQGQPRMNLRGISRKRNSEAATELQTLGIEMVQADLDDTSSLKVAFEGATHIFATTDSNRLIFDAVKNPELLIENDTPRSYAREIELKQGRNIAEAAASIGGLQRIVWSSLASPKKWSNGRYTKVSMFDTKEDIADILASTSELREKLSVLLVGFYATNALKVPQLYGPLRVSDHR